jgi:hypothetical protein
MVNDRRQWIAARLTMIKLRDGARFSSIDTYQTEAVY